jgi:hypothetical protein
MTLGNGAARQEPDNDLGDDDDAFNAQSSFGI